ncbi:MAG: hypothetical protein MSA13_08890 [Prevotella sp.]|nr:hypothetical protein [Prevotella sp.]
MNTHHQSIQHHWALILIYLTLPITLWALLLLQPTCDDWTYYTRPLVDDKWDPTLFLPDNNYWRPFDALIGSLLAMAPSAFPTLNHIIILTAHVASATAVNRLCHIMQTSHRARNTATIIFYCSTGMMGTVLGIDSINQAMATLLGLLSLLAYIPQNGCKPHYATWITLAIAATLTKENGIAWTVITPIMAYGMALTDRRTMYKSLAAGMTAAAAYMVLRLMLADNGGIVTTDNVYLNYNLMEKIHDIGIFLSVTWIPIDYICIIYPSARNTAIVAVTAMTAAPFIIMLLRKMAEMLKDRLTITLLLCIAAAAAPHLLTRSSAMHTYAILPMVVLLMAKAIDRMKGKYVSAAITLYVITHAAVTAHHYIASYHSGMLGERLGKEAITQCEKPVNKVFIINISDGEKKYSSFCVPPFEAFGWGRAACQQTGWQWPKELMDITVSSISQQRLRLITDSAMAEGYDNVWICSNNHIQVIPRKP